jgi:HPt (histidine-containing phosphotransfer) domain-containing protein
LGPGFEAEALERLFALDPEGKAGLVSRLFGAFEDSLRSQVQSLALGIQASDFDRIRRAAHTARSSSRSMGAESFAAACLELEESAHAVDTPAPGRDQPDAAKVLERAGEVVHQAQALLAQVVQARNALASTD